MTKVSLVICVFSGDGPPYYEVLFGIQDLFVPLIRIVQCWSRFCCLDLAIMLLRECSYPEYMVVGTVLCETQFDVYVASGCLVAPLFLECTQIKAARDFSV